MMGSLGKGRGALLTLLLLGCLAVCTRAGENNHRYKDGETVTLWVNKVGPYNNPQVGAGAAAA
jgi:hypothetical protein